MIERALLAGFGGQGIMMMGKLFASMMMDEGKSVLYFPSYGPEVRGGTANCNVIISDEPIASPVIEVADTIIVMNQPSYEKFKSFLSPDGVALINSSLVHTTEPLKAKLVLEAPVTQIAADLGDVRAANMVMTAIYNEVKGFVPFEKLSQRVVNMLGSKKKDPKLVELNMKALEAGRKFAAEHATAKK